jgi:membrane dipeptidase
VHRPLIPPRKHSPAVSRVAADLYAACDVVDLHVESFVWTRLFGYDLAARHGRGPLGAWYFSQADVPRMRQAGLAGAVFSIATNPFRPARSRPAIFLRNLARLRSVLESCPEEVAVVADHAGYHAARAAGRLACFVAVQGANAFTGPEDLGRIPEAVVSRITLVHLNDSEFGATSWPLGRSRGRGRLTPLGREFVAACNQHRILVDLAHISRSGFADTLEAHDPWLPPVVSHTGVCAVQPSWRNLDDDQIRAVAARGGVIGVMYHRGFLGRPSWRVGAGAVVRHLEHAIRVGGEDVAALGSDWDGLIVTPRDMPTVLELPVLVQHMLDRGFHEDRIARILGGNALRVLAAIRPG